MLETISGKNIGLDYN